MNDAKYLLVPADEDYDPLDVPLTLHELGEQIAAELGMVLVPDDSLREDGRRYRMMVHMAISDFSQEAMYMEELCQALPPNLSDQDQAAWLSEQLDKVRAKFGDRPE